MNLKEQEDYQAGLSSKTDRELLELQTVFARMTARNSERIKNNVVFFFWLFIASIIASIILLDQAK